MSRAQDTDALNFYQYLLDRMSDAVMAGDVNSIVAQTKLPCAWKTLASQTILETEEELRGGMIQYCSELAGMGLNNLTRLASRAEYLSPGYIAGWHVTHLLRRDATPIYPTYLASSVYHLENGEWRMVESGARLSSPAWPIKMVRVEETEQVVEDSVMMPLPEDVRREHQEPEAIYQRFLTKLDAANLACDFDAYCDCVSFPFSFHYGEKDIVYTDRTDLADFFEMLCNLVRDKNITRFERKVERAEFLFGNQLCGYHGTTLYSGDTPCVGPIKSRMILRRKGAAWFLSSVTNALDSVTPGFETLHIKDDLVAYHAIQQRTGRQ